MLHKLNSEVLLERFLSVWVPMSHIRVTLFSELKLVLSVFWQDIFKQIIAISSNCKQKGQSWRHKVRNKLFIGQNHASNILISS